MNAWNQTLSYQALHTDGGTLSSSYSPPRTSMSSEMLLLLFFLLISSHQITQRKNIVHLDESCSVQIIYVLQVLQLGLKECIGRLWIIRCGMLSDIYFKFKALLAAAAAAAAAPAQVSLCLVTQQTSAVLVPV